MDLRPSSRTPKRSLAEGLKRSKALLRGGESYSVPSMDSIRASGGPRGGAGRIGYCTEVCVPTELGEARGELVLARLLGAGNMSAEKKLRAGICKVVEGSIAACVSTIDNSYLGSP
nr:hypothetical protein Itr_chr04CG17150 [Ipomoea trifida]